ncbi:hypothetical protein PIB30_066676 [Stylosanthes scabra]|uniref:Uncharacterized protein n=1 Tax=Stylosanthes scabra TaxID=79078 RepID=A0ABU6ZL54_9FABA|nr:hypothetical protein [Stylosanthes scabra]
MRAISKTSTTTTTTTLAPMATLTKMGNTNIHSHSSPWHTPIPYLFGGLAAMLGLIAFALLMLACSYYWKLFVQLQNRQQNGDNNSNNVGDLEKDCDETQRNEPFKAYEEKVLVIMAGNEKPTFLATPVFPNYGKQLICQDCGSMIEDSEVSNNEEVSEKDIINKDNVVVHIAAAATTLSQENQDSQQNQEQEQEENQ